MRGGPRRTPTHPTHANMRMHIPPTYSSNRHTPAQVVAGMQLRNRPLLLKDAHSGAGKSEEMVVGGDDELADDELAGDDAGLAGCGAVHDGGAQTVDDERHDGAERHGGGAAQAVDAPSCDIDKPTANALCHEFQVVDGEIMHGSVSATVVARALAGHQCDIVRPTPLNEHLAACSDVHRSSLGLVCVCPESEWKGGRRNKLLVYTVYNARRSTHGGGSDTWTFDMFFARSDHE